MSIRPYLLAFQQACHHHLGLYEAKQLPVRLTTMEADYMRGLNDCVCEGLRLLFNGIADTAGQQKIAVPAPGTPEEGARTTLQSIIQDTKTHMLGLEDDQEQVTGPSSQGIHWLSFKDRHLAPSDDVEEFQTGRLVSDWEVVDFHDYETGARIGARRFFATILPALMKDYESRINAGESPHQSSPKFFENPPAFF